VNNGQGTKTGSREGNECDDPIKWTGDVADVTPRSHDDDFYK